MSPTDDCEISIHIGDLHGNIDALRRLLEGLDGKYKIFSKKEEMVLRPEVKIIQTGDRIDRDDEGKKVVEACMMMDSSNNGMSAQLFGNHELLALASLDTARALRSTPNPDDNYRWTLHGYNGGLNFVMEFGSTPTQAFENYCEAMKAEGRMGRWFRGLKPFDVTIVGGKRVLSVHGGIPEEIHNPIELLRYVSRFDDHMRGKTDVMGGSERKYMAPIFDERTVFWDRTIPSGSVRAANRLLDSLEIDYLVIGHTPQSDGKIGRYGKRIFNNDVGMAQRYGGHDPAAIVITKNSARSFYASSGEEEPVKRKVFDE